MDVELTGRENQVKPETRPAEVDGVGSTGDAGQSEKDWKKNFIEANKRHEEKLNKKIDELTANLQSLQEAIQSNPSKKDSDVPASGASDANFDYNAWLDKEINSRLESKLGEVQLNSAMAQARKMVESQNDVIQTEEDKVELMALMKEKKLDILFETAPVEAMQLGIELFEKKRGVSNKTVEQRAAGVRGGSPANKDSSEWTRERLKKMSKEDILAHKDDIMAAMKSGQLT